VVADHEVIDKLDIEHFARFNELPGHSNVLGRRGRIAAGVVVGYHNRNITPITRINREAL